MTTKDLKPDDYPADEFDKGSPAYQLAKLQKQMDALAGVKCPCECHRDENTENICEACNGTDLDPKYDCLRVKCFWEPTEPHGHQEIQVENCVDKNWWTLPVERAHEAVGRLMAAIENKDCFPSLAYDPEHKWGNWMATLSEDCIARGDTPEEALMAALRKAEGV